MAVQRVGLRRVSFMDPATSPYHNDFSDKVKKLPHGREMVNHCWNLALTNGIEFRAENLSGSSMAYCNVCQRYLCSISKGKARLIIERGQPIWYWMFGNYTYSHIQSDEHLNNSMLKRLSGE